MSILQRLTEGVQSRNLQDEGTALLNKWEATGLLEGLNEGNQKQGMAVLLENQAKELLREASSMAAGDVEGFAAVAFPIVRRVFGGLIANDLVSVQPMSLPSGLIFFLDFTHTLGNLGAVAGESVYGGNVVGRQLTGGVDLASGVAKTSGGHYEFGHGHSSPTGSTTVNLTELLSAGESATGVLVSALTEADKKLIDYDPDLLAAPTTRISVVETDLTRRELGPTGSIDFNNLAAFVPAAASDAAAVPVRRLTKINASDKVQIVFVKATNFDAAIAAGNTTATVPLADNFDAAHSDAIGALVGNAPWGLEGSDDTGGQGGLGNSDVSIMQEIDIKVDSIAVTAQTKKLKAKWSPELGQDLNAYHNLDAEVELTGILSEQIALEIDRELLNELVRGAKAGTRYWSRAPGLFVDSAGAELGAASAAPDFTGTVSEWYETLIETINDVSAQIHRKTLRGGANFVVCSPEVANILEFTSGFRASVTADQDRGTIGAVKAGSLSKKFDVYVDPYFLRNVLLVGRKGSSFLESGFVYAPYVPLQVTPTIFGTEDFVPRKGVMTRYAKKMVRPDMYGLVVVRGLLGEEGSS